MAKKAVDQVAPKGRKVEIVGGGDVPTYYVNNINIDLSSFDVRFRLSQIQGATDTTLQVKEIAQVYMSHTHFRALVAAVNTTAKKMEGFPTPVSDATKAH